MRCPDCNSKVDPYTRWCSTCHLWVVDAEEDKAEAQENGQDRLFNYGESSKETWKDILGITEIKNSKLLPCPVCGEKIDKTSGRKTGLNREFICPKCNSVLGFNTKKVYFGLFMGILAFSMQIFMELTDRRSHSMDLIMIIIVVAGLLHIFFGEPNGKSLEVRSRGDISLTHENGQSHSRMPFSSRK